MKHAESPAWVTILAVVAAMVTMPFGESVIGVQLDAIAAEFQADGPALQWVVNAYMLTFATSILAVGILGDRHGRRRFFALGLALTGLANGAAIWAPNIDVLILLRALAGMGAGTLLVTGPALLSARFPDPGRIRARAFALFGAATGSGIALGPPIGGLIMGWSDWRMVFAVYLPFVLLSAMLLPRVQSTRGDAGKPIDARGIVLFTALLALVIWGLNGGHHPVGLQAGLWTLAAGLTWMLYRVERRLAHPAIDPQVFLHPIFLSMSLIVVCWQLSIAVSMVYVPALVVAGLGGAPVMAGASIVPMAVVLFASVPLGPMLVRRQGITAFILVCIGLMALGAAVIGLSLGLGPTGRVLGLMAGLILMGIGGGIANGSVDNLALSTQSAGRAGLASGAFQTVRIGSAALAVAAAGAMLNLGERAAATDVAGNAALLQRYATMAGASALLMGAIGMLCVLWLWRRA